MKWFRYGACFLFLISLFFLPDPNEDYLFLQTIRLMAGECLDELHQPSQAGNAPLLPEGKSVRLKHLHVEGAGPETSTPAIEREIRLLITPNLDQGNFFIDTGGCAWYEKEGQVLRALDTKPDAAASAATINITVRKKESRGELVFEMPGVGVKKEAAREYFKLYSILPPLIAILLALLFQKTLLALFFGVLLGSTILEGMNPILGIWRFISRHLYEQALTDQFRLDIIGFVVFLCAMVGVLTRGAGIQGMVKVIVRFAKTVRSTQAVSYLMGLAIFFDDYANCIIVGNTLRPLTDRMKISREKLSYIVDSTAAPVAGLSMLSTWIAYEVSTFSAQLPEAGVQEGAYEVFLQTLPYRFYCILTLVFIAMQILLQRDFGPMLKAEKRARQTGHTIRADGRPMVSSSMTKIEPKKDAPARWINAVFPILFMILVTLEELWRMGKGWDRPLSDLFSASAIREVLGVAAGDNTAKPILIGAVAGFLLAVVMMLLQRILTVPECMKAAASSTKALAFAIAILLLAWCIGSVCVDIGTAYYLIALFKGVIDPVLFPTILFVTSCIVAFATGSSWSTMSILLPNTVIFAMKIGETSSIGAMPMLLISIGAVLEGSIFGDHCSPISDTTVLSSVSTASDHMDHIKTQAPYAVCTMLVAVACGYIPAALGCHPIVSLLTGAAALFLVLLILGRKAI